MFTAEQLKEEYVEIRNLYFKKREEVAALRQDLCDAEAEASRLAYWLGDIERRYDSEYGCDVGKADYNLGRIIKKEREETSE